MRLFNSTNSWITQYNKGQIIHLQNEMCRTMDIVLEGKVAVQKIDEDGGILKINVFSQGGILGANLLFARENYYHMTVVSESPSVLLHISKDLILELSQTNVHFMTGLMTVISDRTLLLTDKIDAISLKTIRQKIIDYLRYEYSLQKSNILKMSITKKDLAERFGIERTSLSRELNKMRKDGLLEYNANTITLKKIDLLK
ncbi:Crp/Fnr family transcriptional regulator [Dehalobacterium formicoaceticum]|uniref:Crp/Fnr family transcriptional regulator n=1 Tax=Dehalobacterium formicoaceticum TaxID=51515 RepID=UPI000B7DE2E7|nr:Crp/Fnr family transcriptional regulator [Dehalobacterium formicoaceticum]